MKIKALSNAINAWKACSRQKRLGGSNPPLSALIFRLLAITAEV